MKKLITPIAIATLSCNAAFAQDIVAAAAGGEEQITTTTTVTRRVAAVAAVAPAPVAPAPRPAPTLEFDYSAAIEAVKSYVKEYISAGSSTAESAALELAFYADHVDYFDNGIVDREFIAKDVRDYAARWPARTFHIEYNRIEVRPVNDNTVRAAFVLKYSVRNDKKFISGAVNNVLLIDYSKGDPRIVSIKSSPIYKREFPAVAM